ncbi:MAG: hypothetical protein JXR84_25440 [Anaerolineae bacterium]|nr:hypothetical protein [Anaerolineae bacterium]
MIRVVRLVVCVLLVGCALTVWGLTTRGAAGTELPTFTLTAEPASKVVPWWESVFSYTISISPTNLPYSVTLLTASVPYDVMVSFSPTYLIPVSVSTMVVNPCGTILLPREIWYTLTVVGVGGGYTQTADVSWIETIPRFRVYLPLTIKSSLTLAPTRLAPTEMMRR